MTIFKLHDTCCHTFSERYLDYIARSYQEDTCFKAPIPVAHCSFIKSFWVGRLNMLLQCCLLMLFAFSYASIILHVFLKNNLYEILYSKVIS